MDFTFILSFPEEMWSADGRTVHPEIQSSMAKDVLQVFGGETHLELSPTAVGAGASAEAILLYVTTPFTIVGGVAGVWFVAEKLKEFKTRLRARTVHARFPEVEAFLSVIGESLEIEDLGKVRLLKCLTVQTGSEAAKFGDFPRCYVYIVGIPGETESGDELTVLLAADDGTLLIQEKVRLNLFLHLFGKEEALSDFLDSTR